MSWINHPTFSYKAYGRNPSQHLKRPKPTYVKANTNEEPDPATPNVSRN